MAYGMEPLTSGFIGQIPVRNIWLLLLYASRLYRELPASRRVDLEDAPDHIPHLVAEILTNAVERRLALATPVHRLPAAPISTAVDADASHFCSAPDRRQLLSTSGRIACIFDL